MNFNYQIAKTIAITTSNKKKRSPATSELAILLTGLIALDLAPIQTN
jgi:hypothetical protein